jgi:hypothetical protein
MKSRASIILLVVVVLALAVVGAAYAYDRGARETIPQGVSIAGIDVGGLKAPQAKAKLERDYLARLRQPVRVHFHARYYTLTP